MVDMLEVPVKGTSSGKALLTTRLREVLYYSGTPVTRTLKGNETLFELAGSNKIFNFPG